MLLTLIIAKRVPQVLFLEHNQEQRTALYVQQAHSRQRRAPSCRLLVSFVLLARILLLVQQCASLAMKALILMRMARQYANVARSDISL